MTARAGLRVLAQQWARAHQMVLSVARARVAVEVHIPVLARTEAMELSAKGGSHYVLGTRMNALDRAL